MKKSVTIVIAILLLAMPLLAQEEKYTEEEALQLVAAYEAREGEANAKAEEEQVKIESLKAQLSELDQAIADIEAEIKAKEEEIRNTYVVKPGDWLSKLAEYPEVYGWGNYARWKEIYNANKDLIKDPDLIYPDWKLKIPRE
ncbi:MAG: LysM peptidoglycan-binding domain-containing protein [candidate division WOR-3 bacterium]|nr:LysM peptidoglycan-binding domain-containing protein [candidate division WOR-3 bacterium]